MQYTFVIDLDGTLLQTDGHLHPDACHYLVQLQEIGHRVVIATGRKYSEAKKMLEQLKLKKFKNAAILSDGQYLLDYQDNTEISERFLAYPDDYRQIMDCFTEVPRFVKLMTAQRDYDVFPSIFCFAMWKRFCKSVIKVRNPFRGVLFHLKGKVDRVEKITVKPRNKNTCFCSDLGEQYQVAFVNDKERFEFKAKAVNKSEMLKKYIAKHGISASHICVFGNDENDLCMFNDFTNSFAVSTARENVKSQARFIVPHSEGLGIIDKIKEIVEER